MNEYIDVIKKNLPKEPEVGTNSVQVTFKFNGKMGPSIFNRNFNYCDKIRDMKNYVKIILRTYENVSLTGLENNKIYVEDNVSLEDAGVKDREMIVVNII
jgi:hypothetical protein